MDIYQQEYPDNMDEYQYAVDAGPSDYRQMGTHMMMYSPMPAIMPHLPCPHYPQPMMVARANIGPQTPAQYPQVQMAQQVPMYPMQSTPMKRQMAPVMIP